MKTFLLLVCAFAACVPVHYPSGDYGKALKACDVEQTEIEWIECCVATARAYKQDPNFCFQ